MLAVLLKILAVIGIIILIILGIILFLILIVLFVPITYKIHGEITEDKKEASAKVNWLFGILRFSLNYTGQVTYRLKLLCFDLTSLLNKKSYQPKSSIVQDDRNENCQDNIQTKENPDSEDTIDSNITTDNSSIDNSSINNSIDNNTDNNIDNNTDNNIDNNIDDNIDISSDPPVKSTISDKVHNLIFKIRSICDKIKHIWNNLSYYFNLLNAKDTKDLISHSFQVLTNILKSIRPRKLKLDAVIGFDSPDTTGKVYGYTCMLYPYYGEDIHIVPDFENKVLSGKFTCSGHIFICVLLLNALRILLDRKLYKLLRSLKKKGNK